MSAQHAAAAGGAHLSPAAVLQVSYSVQCTPSTAGVRTTARLHNTRLLFTPCACTLPGLQGETAAPHDVTSNVERSKHLADPQQAKIYDAEVGGGGKEVSLVLPY